MIYQSCAICEKNNYRVVYKENFDISKINSRIFSARRLPDKIHYQMVRCKKCGLLYSTPILPLNKINKLYRQSFTSYGKHINNLKQTYGTYLKQLEKYQINKNKLLEIGCGNGFFLEEAQKQGYKETWGIEPGKKSVARASPKIKKNIIIDIFRPGLFKKNFFDVICCFQTFDHIPDPNLFLKECYKILKNNGFLLFLNHNAESLSAQILGEKSPIIDIEHTYLYSKKTLGLILTKHNFKPIEVKTALNTHSLTYWIHLFPLSKSFKLNLIKLLKKMSMADINITLPAGNLVVVAQKTTS